MICLPASACSPQLLSPSKPVSLKAETLSEVKLEEPEVEEASAKRSRLSGSTHPVASVSQLIFSTDCLSIIHNFVRRVGIDTQYAEMKAEIRGYLQAKLENARRK